jgi:prepilin peptidase CpaA
VQAFLLIFLGCVLVIAAVIDARHNKIPNLLTYPTMGTALICHSANSGLEGLLLSISGLFIGTGILILPYLMGGMGAGDAKLMGAAGAVLGPRGVIEAFLFTAVIGGIYALLLLLINRRYARGFITRHVTSFKTFVLTRQFIPIPAEKNENTPKLCYGIPIALGTLSYMFLEFWGKKLVL